MGLLDDFVDSGIDMEEVAESSWEIPDGIYEFAVGETYIQNGSKTNDDYKAFCIKYLLNDEDGTKNYTYTERFKYPEDFANLSQADSTRLSIMKSRLLKLGIPENELNTFGEDDLVGVTGTLTLKTKAASGGASFQNISAFNVDEDQEREATPTPAKPASKRPAAKAAPKAVPPAKAAAPKSAPTRRAAKPAPVEEVEDTEVSEAEVAAEEIEEAVEAVAEVEASPQQSLRDRIAARKAAQAKGAAGRPNPLAKRA